MVHSYQLGRVAFREVGRRFKQCEGYAVPPHNASESTSPFANDDDSAFHQVVQEA